MFLYVDCAQVYRFPLNLPTPQSVGSPGAGVRPDCELLKVGAGEWTDPLEEQEVLLLPEPSF